jgi:WD40 repeat protein
VVASGSSDRTVIVWDVRDPAGAVASSVLEGHDGLVSSLAFHPERDVLVAGSYQGTITVWEVGDLSKPVRLDVLQRHAYNVASIAFDPGGRLMATGSGDRTIVLWDIDVLAPRGSKPARDAQPRQTRMTSTPGAPSKS